MKVFKMSRKGILELNTDEVLLIPEFKRLVKRDRGSEGDADGRKKLRAYAEFAYIYHTCDPSSHPTTKGMSKKEADAWARRSCNLPTGWKVDEDMEAAIQRYKELRPSPSSLVLRTIKRGLNVSNDAIEKLIDRVQLNLNKLDAPPQAEDEKDIEKEFSLLVDKLHADLKRLLGLSHQLPETIATISELEEEVAKEISEGHTMKGGKPIPLMADPNA
jgi:hypothetical protein